MQPRLLIAIATLVTALPFAPGEDSASSSPTVRPATLRAEARAVAVEFFRTINERRYERTCHLLVRKETDHELCVVGLRVGFTWSQEIRYRIGQARVRGRKAVVEAVADGSRGELVLVRVAGTYKVLAVRGRPDLRPRDRDRTSERSSEGQQL